MTLHRPRSTLFPYTTLFRSFAQRIPSASTVLMSDRSASNSVSTKMISTGWSTNGRARLMAPAVPSNVFCSTNLAGTRSEEHTSELQSHHDLVCRLLLEKKKH